MSEEVKGGSAAPGLENSVPSQETQANPVESSAPTQDTVKYQTYRNAVGEAKKFKALYEEMMGKAQTLEQGQLEAEGRKDELISALRKQNTELDGKYKQAVGSFARAKALDSIADKAVQMGCADIRLLKKVVEDELSTLDYDDGFNPDGEQVRMLLEKVRQDTPLIFGKPAPAVANHKIGGDFKEEKKSIRDLDDKELMEKFGKFF